MFQMALFHGGVFFNGKITLKCENFKEVHFNMQLLPLIYAEHFLLVKVFLHSGILYKILFLIKLT